MSLSYRLLLCTLILASLPQQVCAGWFFDNGSVTPSNTSWNVTYPYYTAYDNFLVDEPLTLTDIEFSAFRADSNPYVRTYITLLSEFPNDPVLSSFCVAAEEWWNGLESSNPLAPHGFTQHISGLSIALQPGTYVLGISVETENNDGAVGSSIGSGLGSLQTIGDGLIVGSSAYLKDGDHMSFRLGSSALTAVPEPGSIALILSGGVLMVKLRRRLWTSGRTPF